MAVGIFTSMAGDELAKAVAELKAELAELREENAQLRVSQVRAASGSADSLAQLRPARTDRHPGGSG